jgi:hypothetical protein
VIGVPSIFRLTRNAETLVRVLPTFALRCENRTVNRAASRETGLEMSCLSPCNSPRLQGKIFSKVKTSFPTKSFTGLRRTPKVGGGEVFHTPCADFSRPVEELEYTCLLKSTFTES